MTNRKIDIFIGLAFMSFGILLSGVGYMIYVEQSKVLALCGIPIVALVFIGGVYIILGGFSDD